MNDFMKPSIKIIAICILSLNLQACTGTNLEPLNQPDISQAKQYSVLTSNVYLDQVNKTSFLVNEKELASLTRRNIKVHILCPEATTGEQRAHTAMKAAIDIQKATKAHIVDVILEMDMALIGKGYVLATARYAADGKDYGGYGQMDTWDINTSDTQVSAQKNQVARLWYEHRESFQTKDGVTDDDRLKTYISKKYGLKKEQVSLPLISRDEYIPRLPK